MMTDGTEPVPPENGLESVPHQLRFVDFLPYAGGRGVETADKESDQIKPSFSVALEDGGRDPPAGAAP
jgi:hypothetical protein